MQKSDTPSRNDAPFQKIDDAVRSTGLSAYYLRRGCRNGSVPCIRSGRTFYVNIPALLDQLTKGGERL